MVLFEMNSHSLWRQKDCRILLTSGIFSLRLFLSVRVVRPETTTCTLRMACTDFLGEINDLLRNFSCLEDVKRARPSVDNKLIALSPQKGFHVVFLSSTVAPGKELTRTLCCFVIFLPWRCLMIESPAIMIDFFLTGSAIVGGILSAGNLEGF